MTKASMDLDYIKTFTPNHLLLLKTQPSLPPGDFQQEDV